MQSLLFLLPSLLTLSAQAAWSTIIANTQLLPYLSTSTGITNRENTIFPSLPTPATVTVTFTPDPITVTQTTTINGSSSQSDLCGPQIALVSAAWSRHISQLLTTNNNGSGSSNTFKFHPNLTPVLKNNSNSSNMNMDMNIPPAVALDNDVAANVGEEDGGRQTEVQWNQHWTNWTGPFAIIMVFAVVIAKCCLSQRRRHRRRRAGYAPLDEESRAGCGVTGRGLRS